MITTVIECKVKCGSKNTIKRIGKIKEVWNAEQIEAVSFRCRRCHKGWNTADFSGGADLDRVCCSNCYSSNVEITKIKLTFLTAKDFRA